MALKTRGDMRKLRRYLLVALLALLALCCFFFPGVLGFRTVTEVSHDIVEDALKNNAKAFVVVSGIKAMIAIIEGSTTGIVFLSIEIGDSVQSVYDFVDYIWKVLLYGLFILSLYAIILETELLEFGTIIMGAAFLLFAFYMAFPAEVEKKPWKDVVRTLQKYSLPAAKIILFLGLLIAYLAPLSILSSFSLKRYVIESAKQRKVEQMRELEKEFGELKEDFLSLRATLSLAYPMESFDRLRAGMDARSEKLRAVFDTALLIFLSYSALVFTEIVLFPLLMAFALYKLSSFLFFRVLGLTTIRIRTDERIMGTPT